MPTHYTAYGYPYPDPVDPLKNGAADIGALANTLHTPEPFSGQPALAGSLPGGQNWRIRHLYYNYAAATDAFGLLSIPLPFTQVLCSAAIMPRNFRDPSVISIALAQEYCTVTNLAGYVRDVTGNGVSSHNCELTIMAWGY